MEKIDLRTEFIEAGRVAGYTPNDMLAMYVLVEQSCFQQAGELYGADIYKFYSKATEYEKGGWLIQPVEKVDKYSTFWNKLTDKGWHKRTGFANDSNRGISPSYPLSTVSKVREVINRKFVKYTDDDFDDIVDDIVAYYENAQLYSGHNDPEKLRLKQLEKYLEQDI